MTSRVRKLSFAAGASPLGVVPFSTALGNMANMKAVWTAGIGHEGSGWRDRKNGALLTPQSGIILPTPIDGGPNGTKKVSIVASGTPSLESASGANLLPLDASFSLWQIVRPAASAAGNGTIFGNSVAMGLWFGLSNVDPIQTALFRAAGAAILAPATTGNAFINGFQLWVLSYEWVSGTSQTTKIYRNGSILDTVTANHSAYKLTNQRLRMFGAGTAGADAKWSGDYVDGGVYWGALGASANAADLAAIEAYVETNYNLY